MTNKGSRLFNFTPKYWFSTNNNFMIGITLEPWVRLLWSYGHAIDWRTYWFRVLFLSIMACVNTCLSWIEWMLHGERIKRTEVNRRPVFILGHFRSGTTHLHNLLALDDEYFFTPSTLAAIFPSTYLLLHPWRGILGHLLGKTRPMDNMSLSFDVPQEDELAYTQSTPLLSMYAAMVLMTKEEHFRKYCRMQDVPEHERDRYTKAMMDFLRKVSVHAKERRLVLKSPTHTAKIQFLLQLFPDAQFIFIHRDPYRVFRSVLHMADKTYWYSYLASPTDQQIAEFVLHQYEEICNAYIEHRHLISQGNLIEISYAELEQDGIGTIRKIYETLGWDGFETRVMSRLKAYLSSLQNYRKNDYGQLTDSQRRIINHRWGRCFKHFGYRLKTRPGHVNLQQH
eukprot:m.99722 g.99722  ORF g.99722 m.99722 type:complete len:396 (+) comp14913_c1_seq8:355-1542(+)